MRDGPRPTRLRPARLAVLAVGLTGLAWGGCSIERDYEVLSFFFDGVPPPPGSAAAEAVAARRGSSAGGLPESIVSYHTAYRERRCPECHGDRAKFGFQTAGFSDVTAEVCLKCHADSAEAPHVHGPVGAGLCLDCHEAHVSSLPALLTQPGPDLCTRCHDPDMAVVAIPEHADRTRSCLDCHHGHGGADPYFLRQEFSEPAAPIEAPEPER